jgi:hypothetical protein
MYSHQIPEPEFQKEEPRGTASPQFNEPVRFPVSSDDCFADDCEDEDLRPVPDVTIRGFLHSVFGR